MLEPFYFGDSDRRLFGVYHFPVGSQLRRSGIVLCPATGQEHIRAYRAFLNLALILAEAGFHVLRFDYAGCGDSAEHAEIAPEHLTEDVLRAVNELREGSGVESLALVGLRIGGALAALAAERTEIEALVLWNPILEGTGYLQELQSRHAQWAAGSFVDGQSGAEPSEALGFPLPRELETLDLRPGMNPPAQQILVVCAEEECALYESWREDAQVDFRRCDSPAVWLKQGQGAESALVPVDLIQEIVSWLCLTLK